jgi:hypothetical protein
MGNLSIMKQVRIGKIGNIIRVVGRKSKGMNYINGLELLEKMKNVLFVLINLKVLC